MTGSIRNSCQPCAATCWADVQRRDPGLSYTASDEELRAAQAASWAHVVRRDLGLPDSASDEEVKAAQAAQ
jgi:hypothetical protein